MFTKIKTLCTKIIISSILISSILINPVIANATTLQDIDLSSNYAKYAIIELAEKNIIVGDENGNFNPHKTVTRAEMIKMIVNALEIDTTNVPNTPTFNDVPNTHWSYKYVEAAYREGIVKGMSAEEFGESEQCTREQMTVMFVRSLGLSNETINVLEKLNHVNELSDKDMVSDWAKVAVEFSLVSGLMKGTSNTTFKPQGHAERQQSAVVIHRLINNKETILELAEEISETVKYPNLYEALLASEDFRAEFNVDALMNFYGTAPGETMTINTFGTGLVNGSDFHMDIIMSIEQDEMILPAFNLQMTKIGSNIYIKEPGSGTWVEATPEDAEDLATTEELKQINAHFFNVYNMLPIEKVGTIEIEGINTTKYTLFLDDKTVKDILTEELLVKLGFEASNELNLEIEYYINEQNQIIRQVVNYNGNLQVDEENLDFEMLIDMNYNNIGANIVIFPPVIDTIEEVQ